jgi:hypothetical protein
MSKEKSAPQPKTFSELMHNPKKDYTQGAFATLLWQLENRCDIEPSMMAEVMFDYLLLQMQPRGDLTQKDVMIWVGQLQRFRDAADVQLEEIKNIYKKIHNSQPS